ncbi:unnamed protein product [Tenebrio molitor]|nr:unnamed protein product [Tenebrio molitor]
MQLRLRCTARERALCVCWVAYMLVVCYCTGIRKT